MLGLDLEAQCQRIKAQIISKDS